VRTFQSELYVVRRGVIICCSRNGVLANRPVISSLPANLQVPKLRLRSYVLNMSFKPYSAPLHQLIAQARIALAWWGSDLDTDVVHANGITVRFPIEHNAPTSKFQQCIECFHIQFTDFLVNEALTNSLSNFLWRYHRLTGLVAFFPLTKVIRRPNHSTGQSPPSTLPAVHLCSTGISYSKL